MYMQAEVARQRQEEMLERAGQARLVSQVRAMNRARRRLARAERKMCRARVDATRFRRELEAEA
jgi:uncharacterized protein YlxW (UPF0749 family)